MSKKEPKWQLCLLDEDQEQVLSHPNDNTKENISPSLTEVKGKEKRFENILSRSLRSLGAQSTRLLIFAVSYPKQKKKYWGNTCTGELEIHTWTCQLLYDCSEINGDDYEHQAFSSIRRSIHLYFDG